MTNPEQTYAQHARALRELLLTPQYVAALVAWDRDIEPLLLLHVYHWGNTWPIPYRGMPESALDTPWVSLSTGGLSACCHYRFDPDREAWIRMMSPAWSPNTVVQCPLDVLR